MVICDTNVVIELFKNNQKIKTKISKIGFNKLAVSAITVGELYFGAFNKKEMQQIEKHLRHYQILDLTPPITKVFIQLMHNYSLSHKPFIGDIFIAATAIAHNFELFTLNIKDFKYISEIKLTPPR